MAESRVYWILLTLLLMAIAATACGGTVYKWQDAAGNVHYTDTPPPAGASVLKGPMPAKAAHTDQDKPMPQAPCRPDISAADCELARKALQRGYEDRAHRAAGRARIPVVDFPSRIRPAGGRDLGRKLPPGA